MLHSFNELPLIMEYSTSEFGISTATTFSFGKGTIIFFVPVSLPFLISISYFFNLKSLFKILKIPFTSLKSETRESNDFLFESTIFPFSEKFRKSFLIFP